MTVGAGFDPRILAWICRTVGGGRVVEVVSMPRARMRLFAVDVETGEGSMVALVLRVYGDAERLRTDPWYVPGNEQTALRLLEPTSVPAPRLVAADLDGSVFRMPTLLTTRLAGTRVVHPEDLDPSLVQLASVLPPIHAVDAAGIVPEYRPYRSDPPSPLASLDGRGAPRCGSACWRSLTVPAPSRADASSTATSTPTTRSGWRAG